MGQQTMGSLLRKPQEACRKRCARLDEMEATLVWERISMKGAHCMSLMH